MNNDEIYRFLIDKTNVRGEWVQLNNTWQTIASLGDYPKPLQHILGEAVAAVALLAATIKYNGSLILQMKSDGIANMLVVQATSEGAIRGLASWEGDINDNHTFKDLFHSGYLAITVQPEDDGERYQGVVALEGDSLADTLQHYFDQSEQLPTRLWLSANESVVGGILLQQLPGESEDSDGWNRLNTLTETVTSDELISLDVQTLLNRLFHQEELVLYEAKPLRFECTCSQEKINKTIISLGKEEVISIIKEQGSIIINCHFCNALYKVDSIDVEKLFFIQVMPSNQTEH